MQPQWDAPSEPPLKLSHPPEPDRSYAENLAAKNYFMGKEEPPSYGHNRQREEAHPSPRALATQLSAREHRAAIAAAAKESNDLREDWLKPPELTVTHPGIPWLSWPPGTPVASESLATVVLASDSSHMSDRALAIHISFLILIVCLAGYSQPSPAPRSAANDADAAFTHLAGEYLAGYLAWRPQTGTALGFHQYNGKVTDYSKQSLDAELARLKSFDQRLGGVNTNRLSRQAYYDYRILRGSISERCSASTRQRSTH